MWAVTRSVCTTKSAATEDLLIEVRTADRQSMTYSHDVVIHGPFLCEPDANEANDTAETATETIQTRRTWSLSLCLGDVDWYRIGKLTSRSNSTLPALKPVNSMC